MAGLHLMKGFAIRSAVNLKRSRAVGQSSDARPVVFTTSSPSLGTVACYHQWFRLTISSHFSTHIPHSSWSSCRRSISSLLRPFAMPTIFKFWCYTMCQDIQYRASHSDVSTRVRGITPNTNHFPAINIHPRNRISVCISQPL